MVKMSLLEMNGEAWMDTSDVHQITNVMLREQMPRKLLVEYDFNVRWHRNFKRSCENAQLLRRLPATHNCLQCVSLKMPEKALWANKILDDHTSSSYVLLIELSNLSRRLADKWQSTDQSCVEQPLTRTVMRGMMLWRRKKYYQNVKNWTISIHSTTMSEDIPISSKVQGSGKSRWRWPATWKFMFIVGIFENVGRSPSCK